MAKPIIPLVDHRTLGAMPHVPAIPAMPNAPIIDAFARPLSDLRISVTDRCNFRCVYCMPKAMFGDGHAFLPQSSLLSFEELVRITSLFVAHGVRKIRLTGGEPLLRKQIERLVALLHALRTPAGNEIDLTLTTNGSLLARKARALKSAGLKRITVSLDALDEAIFRQMSDADFAVKDVLHALDAAHAVGLGPIKINMVVKRGVNDGEILPMARYFKNTPFTLRFIEYMDVGDSNGWKMDEVVPSSDIIRRIDTEIPLEKTGGTEAGETAERWRYRDGNGEIGVISSVTQAFCHSCSRARLSAEGRLYTCLFATEGHDLRALLRTGKSDEEIAGAIAHIWRQRTDRYSALRNTSAAEPASARKKIEMSYIGG